MQRDRFGYAVHGQIAQNIASLRSGLFDTAAFERDRRIFFDREEFRAAQMIIALHNSRVDAADIDMCYDRRIFRMLPVDLDLAVEFGEPSVGRTEKLMNRKPNRRMRLIEFVGFVRQRDRTQNGDGSDSSDNS